MPEPDGPPAGDPAEPAPHPAPAGDQPRQRLARSLLHPQRRQVVVALLLALLGFAAVTQVRANEVDDSYEGLREQELIDVLNGLAGARQRAETQREELVEVRDDLQSTTDRRRAALEQAEEQVATLSILAGTVPVTGSGVRVTITEPDGQVLLGSLLDVIQELRTGRAEAMQINGEVRIVAETAFEAAPGGFEVDGTLVRPPYVIDAIGEPDLLAGAVDWIGGPKRQIAKQGGELEVEQVPSLDIESVRRSRQPAYAEPADSE